MTRRIALLLIPLLLTAGCSSEPQGEHDPLQGLGYLSGYEEAPGERGVVVHDPDSTYAGYTLYQSYDAPVARLVDMNGNLVHQWKVTYREAFGDSRPRLRPELPIDDLDMRFVDFRAFPNGDLLAVFPLMGMVKLDRHSNVIGARLNHAHHEINTDRAGRVWVLEKWPVKVNHWRAKWYEIDDRITVYTPDLSDTIASYSMYRALERSNYRGLLSGGAWQENDLLHTNNFAFVPPEHYLRTEHGADLLVSLRRNSSLVGLDTGTKKVVWAATGRVSEQHDPMFLPDGRIAVFDNGTFRKQSRIAALDPRTREVETLWTRDDFYTKCCGEVERLPNGNMLISESESGVVYEVTPEGSVAWKFVNPYDAPEDPEKIATIHTARRYPPDYFTFLRDD